MSNYLSEQDRFGLCKMMEVLSGAMGAAIQCHVTFEVGDAMLERFIEGAFALLRNAGYTAEDLTETWHKQFKGL